MQPNDEDRSKTANRRSIRPCDGGDVPALLAIVNAAAEAYRGVIPADRWHEPYMPIDELKAETAAGVRFTGYVQDGSLIGVMGIQTVRNVYLIRHGYVWPGLQGHGVGSALLAHLRGANENPILIGTWTAATCAIRFYERHGFEVVPSEAIAPLLRTYWNVPDRQIETSVVLASPALTTCEAARLIAHSVSS